MTGSNIINSGGWAFNAEKCSNQYFTIEAIDNWWGTTDEVAIGAMIYDGADDYGRPTVAYIPCATGPFPISGAVTGILEPNDPPDIPRAFMLSQNYPNPFNTGTTISYALNQPGDVTVEVFNVLGQRIWDTAFGYQDTGRYSVFWDGRNANGRTVSSGIYFYRLSLDDQFRTKKMVLLK